MTLLIERDAVCCVCFDILCSLTGISSFIKSLIFSFSFKQILINIRHLFLKDNGLGLEETRPRMLKGSMEIKEFLPKELSLEREEIHQLGRQPFLFGCSVVKVMTPMEK